MLKQVLPKWFLGFTATSVILFNTCLCGSIIFILGLVKLILPFRWLSDALHFIYQLWCRGNRLGLYIGCADIRITMSKKIQKKAWYLLVSNHISWLDIVVLSALDALPAPKFFLKDELKYVPFIGSGAWAMGMPFMKRASKAQMLKNPHLKGLDVTRTRQSCKNFKTQPTTIINFSEGTRFTTKKQTRQGAVFTHLLKPKAGGTAFALEVLQNQLDGFLNTTLVYIGHKGNICLSFMQGQLTTIDISVELIDIETIPVGNYQQNRSYRIEFQSMMNRLWQRKDVEITTKLQTYTPTHTEVDEEIPQL